MQLRYSHFTPAFIFIIWITCLITSNALADEAGNTDTTENTQQSAITTADQLTPITPVPDNSAGEQSTVLRKKEEAQLIAQLIGSWNVDIEGNVPKGYPAFFSFFPGGVMLKSDTPLLHPKFGHRGVSNGHGQWQLIRKGKALFIAIHYLRFTYDADYSYEQVFTTTGLLQLKQLNESPTQTEQLYLQGELKIDKVIMTLSGEKITIPDEPIKQLLNRYKVID